MGSAHTIGYATIKWLTNGSTMVQVTNNDAKTGGYHLTLTGNEVSQVLTRN